MRLAEQWPTQCARCGADLRTTPYSMSRFDVSYACSDCLADEELAPGYPRAHAAELRAVRQGNMNFPGVGLSHADHEFLARRRAARKPITL